MLTKVLVANRGEIAIRAFRAATELGLRTVAVYPHEDHDSQHRLKADEAYQIGEPGHPVRAYLNGDAIIALAREVGADAIYPGYGFLSENADFAAACAAAGLVFVGPPAEVLALTGDKIRARQAASDAGIPVLSASAAVTDPDEAPALAAAIGFPVFVKAAAGGGGRGLRRVERAEDLPSAVATAMREAESTFADSRVFLEQALTRPRHIEVQLLAGADGEIIHLFERDCSLQRRHQKVLEVAPAPSLDPQLRDRLCRDAIRFGAAVGYRNAGTVEFLVGAHGEHVFIEMNPRIQVEHTVTEEVTDVDLVQSQLRIAGGATLSDLELDQHSIALHGVALQCRITTEDPANSFRPDTGRISAYRSAAGAGIRLDAGSAFVGAQVSPYFDSMLVKLTARGRSLDHAAQRARRALAEFRVRGVSTNMAFLRAVLADPDFLAGHLSTAFVDERPHLLATGGGADRATRLLDFLADVTVNQPHGPPPSGVTPLTKLPAEPEGDPPPGTRQRLKQLGPAGFARWLRDRDALAVTDTTLRDAHQSLLATRMRSYDMLAVAPHLAHGLAPMLSFEVWGGATFDVALRFLHEDPWQRLARLREAIPNVCLQMLLRGQNVVGYSRYPPRVVRAFVTEATTTGIDLFRIFDALNDVGQMRPAIEATLEAGALAEGTLCYTGDLSDPAQRVYTLDHYLEVAEALVAAGVHLLCVKDMAGLLRAPAAATLIGRLRREFDLPVHLHTHDTAGGQLGTYVAAAAAGVDAVDAAQAPLSGMTSQPNIAAVVAATDHTARATGLDLDALGDLEPYWEAVRDQYRPFEAGLRSPTGNLYRHEIPGGQLSNLHQQAIEMGLGDRFEELAGLYARCNDLLGDLIKVTPTSKVVGDLAIYLASSGIDPDDLVADPSRYDLPASVVGYLRGELGTPPGGWPEPFRARALAGRDHHEAAAAPADDNGGSDAGGGSTPAPRDAGARDEPGDAGGDPASGHGGGDAATDDGGDGTSGDALAALDGDGRRDALNRLLFPGPAADRADVVDRYGDVSVVPTRAFLYGLEHDREVEVDLERGVRLFIQLEAVGEPDERGMRTLLCSLNGQTRPVDARDRSLDVAAARAEKADLSDPAHVAAPYTGVVTVAVDVGDRVEAGQPIATIEAMKMESSISAPHAGTVERVVVTSGTAVEPGDLVLVLAG